MRSFAQWWAEYEKSLAYSNTPAEFVQFARSVAEDAWDDSAEQSYREGQENVIGGGLS